MKTKSGIEIVRITHGDHLIYAAPTLPVKPERVKSDKAQRSMADTPLFDRDNTTDLFNR